jgi:hypothetical protein
VTNTGTFEVPDARSARILNDSTNAGLMGIFSPGTGTLGISSGRRLFNTGTLAATNSGTLVVEGPGTLVNDGGTISVGVGSAVNVTANLSNLNAATGVLAGGTYDVAGILRFNNANIVSNAVTASIRLDGSASQGNIVDQIGQNALRGFANNSGTFTLANKAFNTSAAFTNAGTVNIGTGSSFTSAGSYTQTGGVTILNGVLTAANVSIQGGSLQGVGSIGGNVINTATAGAGTSPGLLTISGDYVQTASGHLLSEIAGLAPGTQYDVVDVHGTATLAGAIDVVLLDGFSPTADAYFDVLFADVILGEFDTESLPTLTGGVLSIAYLLDPAGLDVVRVSFDFDDGKLPPSVPPTRDDLPPPGTLPLAIPLPSTWALLIAGLLAMGLYPARKAI